MVKEIKIIEYNELLENQKLLLKIEKNYKFSINLLLITINSFI